MWGKCQEGGWGSCSDINTDNINYTRLNTRPNIIKLFKYIQKFQDNTSSSRSNLNSNLLFAFEHLKITKPRIAKKECHRSINGMEMLGISNFPFMFWMLFQMPAYLILIEGENNEKQVINIWFSTKFSSHLLIWGKMKGELLNIMIVTGC